VSYFIDQLISVPPFVWWAVAFYFCVSACLGAVEIYLRIHGRRR
jgi:hypothetical protein